MSGGIIFPKTTKDVGSSQNVSVTWDWHDEANGIVEWNFQNNSDTQQSVILYRNSYFFGNAFWPVYEANPSFEVAWATSLTPLTDNGVSNNSPPIGLVGFGANQLIVAFVFTLGPKQDWSMIEGGYSSFFPPSGVQLYEVTLTNTGEYCIGYDPAQVTDWDTQSGTNYQGYLPNPNAFTTVAVQAPSNAPYVQLFPKDTAVIGACSPTPPTQCLQEIEQGISDLNVQEIIDGILCLLQQYSIGVEDLLERKIKKDISKL